MSSAEEIEVKAGHPPALKVGGVRIPQRHKGTEEKEAAPVRPHRDSENEKDEEEMVVTKSQPKPPVIVSGVVANVQKDYPTAGVKHTHEKPLPTHEPRSTHVNNPFIIQQPKK